MWKDSSLLINLFLQHSHWYTQVQGCLIGVVDMKRLIAILPFSVGLWNICYLPHPCMFSGCFKEQKLIQSLWELANIVLLNWMIFEFCTSVTVCWVSFCEMVTFLILWRFIHKGGWRICLGLYIAPYSERNECPCTLGNWWSIWTAFWLSTDLVPSLPLPPRTWGR